MTTPDGLTAEAVLDICHRDLTTPEAVEWLAGKLLVLSATQRVARGGPDDAHEIRHLHAALEAGNTDGDDPAACRLDGEALARHVRETGCDGLREALVSLLDEVDESSSRLFNAAAIVRAALAPSPAPEAMYVPLVRP